MYSVSAVHQDPDGYVMRWWPSRPTNNGVVSLCFQLPPLPKTGLWTIRVKVRGQLQEKKVAVQKYYVPRYEVSGHSALGALVGFGGV